MADKKSRLSTMYKEALVDYIENGITRDDILLVVARLFVNRREFCDEDCEDDEIHFHDVRDWADKNEYKSLRSFWARISSPEANAYIDELLEFTQTIAPTLQSLIKPEEYFETFVKEESREFVQGLIDKKDEIVTQFPFQCAAIGMLLEMHESKDTKSKDELRSSKEKETRDWFEDFFELFLDDYDEDDSDQDESDEAEETERS